MDENKKYLKPAPSIHFLALWKVKLLHTLPRNKGRSSGLLAGEVEIFPDGFAFPMRDPFLEAWMGKKKRPLDVPETETNSKSP